MQIRSAGYRVRGFLAAADRALCWDMISADAEQRFRILCFWEKHGFLATQEAFGVLRRTLYAWRRRLRIDGGKPAPPAHPLDILAEQVGNEYRMYWPNTWR